MSPISPDLLALLADPETHEPLTLASDAELAALRREIEAGRARTRSGKVPSATLEAALLTPGKRTAYPVVDGIAALLLDDRIELGASLDG